MKIIHRVIQYKYLLLLFLIVAILCARNYEPGTFLTGWDTLHPELDFPTNFSRLFFGVWREEQGLGAVAGHSHMADLPRVIILWVLNLLLPLSTLRYAYIALCLLLGPLGMYSLVQYLFRNIVKHKKNTYTGLISFTAALIYLFNLSTVQQFYVPFEMFPTQYAFLPWIMLYTLKILHEGGKKNYLLFAVITLLGTPQAYAAHLWYAFFGTYVAFLALYTVLSGSPIPMLKKSAALVILTLAINAFWLIPNMYYVISSSDIPQESKQNRLHSQEFRLRNREHGYLQEVALAKGFYFNWAVFDFQEDQIVPLMSEWNDHISHPGVMGIGYLLFSTTCAGVILCFIQREKVLIASVPFFLLPFTLLMNRTPPFEQFFDFLISFSLFQEGFRFIFTKMSILLIFGYSVYFIYAFAYLLRTIPWKESVSLAAAITMIVLEIYTFPMVQGELISPRMRVSIPQEYFAFWEFMKTQPKGTIASLPLHDYAGWQYYSWGYQGAGFIWFGLKQPVLDRDFDRWSTANEQAFRELQYTLYKRDEEMFLQTLKKYNSSYILWDKHITTAHPQNRDQVLFTREIGDILSQLQAEKKITLLKTFNKNLSVYALVDDTSQINLVRQPAHVQPAYKWNYYDFAHQNHGTYITRIHSTGQNTDTSYFYPTRDILNAKDRMNPERITIDLQEQNWTVANTVPQSFTRFVFPNYLQTEDTLINNVYVEKDSESESIVVNFQPFIPLGLTTGINYTLPDKDTNTQEEIEINETEYTIPPLEDEEQEYIGYAFLHVNRPNIINGQTVTFNIDENTIEEQTVTDTNSFANTFPLLSRDISARELWMSQEEATSGAELVKNTNNSSVLSLRSFNTSLSLSSSLEDIPHGLGHILMIRAKNIQGLPLRVCLENTYTNLCIINDELSKSSNFSDDYFVVPPTGLDTGYSLSISNISYGDYVSKNQLEGIKLIPFQYNFISNFRYSNVPLSQTTGSLPEETKLVFKTDLPFLKTASDIDQTTRSFLSFSQSSNPAWNLYVKEERTNLFGNLLQPFISKPLDQEKKVTVNNWANGWDLDEVNNESNSDNTLSLILVFWPQYLQFLGFVLLTIAFGGIVFYPKAKK